MSTRKIDISSISNEELNSIIQKFELKSLTNLKLPDERSKIIEQLQHFLKVDLHQEKLKEMSSIMDQIYGPYKSNDWKPKPYEEGKGRYLWTDAYGVCNYLSLYHETKDETFLKRAELLIEEVHEVLGKDREGKNRLGNSTKEEPLLGGLRIGKKDPEGTRDGDGQYFHYLTKWMFALNRMTLITGDPKYNQWAVSLIKSIHPRFVAYRDSERPRMFWKMNINLTKPVVPSEGNLDPFDGYVTYRIVQSCCSDKSILEKEILELKKIVDKKYSNYYSDDPLDLGEALWIAHFFPQEQWASKILKTSQSMLDELWNYGYFKEDPISRLGFREFGTTIGVQLGFPHSIKWMIRVHSLHQFWSKRIFMRDRDITPVMYCTSLVPTVFSSDFMSKPQSN